MLSVQNWYDFSVSSDLGLESACPLGSNTRLRCHAFVRKSWLSTEESPVSCMQRSAEHFRVVPRSIGVEKRLQLSRPGQDLILSAWRDARCMYEFFAGKFQTYVHGHGPDHFSIPRRFCA